MEWDTLKFWNQPIVYTAVGGIFLLLSIVLAWSLGWIGPLFVWLNSFCTAPKLTLTFKDDKAHVDHFRTGVEGVFHQHLRVGVQNDRRQPVENVRAKLTKVERWEEEDFVTIYEDTYPLIWSGNENDRERTLNHGDKPFVDVILCDSRDGIIQPCLFPQHPVTRQYNTVHSLSAELTKTGDYRFTIEVTSKNAPKETITITVRWDGTSVAPIFPKRRFFG